MIRGSERDDGRPTLFVLTSRAGRTTEQTQTAGGNPGRLVLDHTESFAGNDDLFVRSNHEARD